MTTRFAALMAFRSNRRRLGAKPGFLQLASHPCNTSGPWKGSTTARREWRSRRCGPVQRFPPRSQAAPLEVEVAMMHPAREFCGSCCQTDILSGRTSRRLHCAQRLSAMPRKRQSIGSELPASISGKPRRRSALSQPHACKAKNGFSYVTYSRLESSIASKSSAPHKTKANVARRISSNR